jgi:hypothetical protein
MDGDQPDLERERNPTFLSRTYASSHVLLSITPAHCANVQLDPGPTATIGGMLSTGCSGSQRAHDTVLRSYTESSLHSQRGAIWYSERRMVPKRGQLSRPVSGPREMLSVCVDGCPSVWGGDQDETPLAQVVGRV